MNPKVYLSFLACTFIMTLLHVHGESIPQLINYQGKLTNAEGIALEGQYELEVRLFDSATNGTLIWSEKRMVAVIEGVFNVALGGEGAQAIAGATVNDIGFAFGGPERFLETRIVAGPEQDHRANADVQ